MGGRSLKYATADSRLAGVKRDDDDDGEPMSTLLDLFSGVAIDNGEFPPRKCDNPPLIPLAIRVLFGFGSTAEYGGGGASSESITDVYGEAIMKRKSRKRQRKKEWIGLDRSTTRHRAINGEMTSADWETCVNSWRVSVPLV